MALTLVEASKLTQDMMVRGVIETIVSESQVLNYLPFAEVVGNPKTICTTTRLCTGCEGHRFRRFRIGRPF